jgi:hypothetical protein
LPELTKLLVCFVLFLLPLSAWPARNAVVVAEKAIIWAEAERASPLGFVRKGKILRVGEVERAKGQVLPVLVSGRVGYVAVQDVSFTVDTTAERPHYNRFQEATLKRYGDQLIFGGLLLTAKESTNKGAGRQGDSFSFVGGFVKGLVPSESVNRELGFLIDYSTASKGSEKFKRFNLGFGGAWSMVNRRSFKLKLEVWGLFSPFSQFKNGRLYTENGWALGALGQTSATGYFNDNWGVEASAGVEVFQIFGMTPPKVIKNFDPRFLGTRFSLGAVYRF